MESVENFISTRLHNLLFLEEFVFARNKFTPPKESELELADAAVLLGDVLAVYQIKERAANEGEEAERKWFEGTVIKHGSKQIRDTLRYLESYDKILVPNERGRTFNLAKNKFSQIIKIIIYRPSPALPDDCRQVKYYVSKTAGFIHVINAEDYLNIGKTLRVPNEVIKYFNYRENILTNGNASGITEAAIAGHFIGGDLHVPPSSNSVDFLKALVQDEKDWDLAPLLRGLHDHLSDSQYSDDYYQILIEFAKLPRSMWREIKKRIVLCVDKARKDEFARPYRVAFPETDCGFVFVPVTSDLSKSLDWAEIRIGGLKSFTLAHKYDQKLFRCVGVMVSKNGDFLEIYWCLIEAPWTEDKEARKELDENFPFRPINEAVISGYNFRTD